jgi:hypothetical protein
MLIGRGTGFIAPGNRLARTTGGGGGRHGSGRGTPGEARRGSPAGPTTRAARPANIRGMGRLNPYAPLLAVLAGCAVIGVCAAFALLFIAKPSIVTAPDYHVGDVGGLQYDASQGRLMDPSQPVDASMLAGLPRGERAQPAGHALFGAFITISNDSSRPLPAPGDIELRDAGGHVYQPISLPASNPYAYEPRPIPPETTVPAQGTTADDNLAAAGQLLLFRIPVSAYVNGPLQLDVHDASNPAQVTEVLI